LAGKKKRVLARPHRLPPATFKREEGKTRTAIQSKKKGSRLTFSVAGRGKKRQTVDDQFQEGNGPPSNSTIASDRTRERGGGEFAGHKRAKGKREKPAVIFPPFPLLTTALWSKRKAQRKEKEEGNPVVLTDSVHIDPPPSYFSP